LGEVGESSGATRGYRSKKGEKGRLRERRGYRSRNSLGGSKEEKKTTKARSTFYDVRFLKRNVSRTRPVSDVHSKKRKSCDIEWGRQKLKKLAERNHFNSEGGILLQANGWVLPRNQSWTQEDLKANERTNSDGG